MATWVAHFRLVENLLERGFKFDVAPFLVGNIGPDCGVPTGNGETFEPSKDITHWHDEGYVPRAEDFYKTYLTDGQGDDPSRYAFLMGYYLHLLTDIEWIWFYRHKKKTHPAYRDTLAQNPAFIWEIKKDWYGLDFLYLESNPESLFFTTFQHIKSFPDYLDYFPAGAVESQVRHITNYYLSKPFDLNRPYEYLPKQEMDDFIAATTESLVTSLRQKLE